MMPYMRITDGYHDIQGQQARSVFVAMASYANNRTGVCWASSATLGKKAKMLPSNVRDAQRSLVKQGVIAMSESNPGLAKAYRLDSHFFVYEDSVESTFAAEIMESRVTVPAVALDCLGSQGVTVPAVAPDCLGSHKLDYTRLNNYTNTKTTDSPAAISEQLPLVETVVADGSTLKELVAKKKNPKPKREYHPEAWSVVDFYATEHRGMFPNASQDVKWRNSTRVIADRLIRENAQGDASEVKRRIKCFAEFLAPQPEEKWRQFSLLVQLERRWGQFEATRTEVARFAGYQSSLSDAPKPEATQVSVDELATLRTGLLGQVAA